MTAIAVSAALALTACGGGGTGPGAIDGVGSAAPPPPPATSRLDLAITDAPLDRASRVVIVFTGVDVKPARGETISFDYCADPVTDRDDCRSIDLLKLRGGATEELLREEAMPPGEYEWLRLRTYTDPTASDASHIEIDGSTLHNLVIPGGAESGLKLDGGFGLGEGDTTRLLIDFDLRKSIVALGGAGRSDSAAARYLLKPRLRLMHVEDTASITGDVDLAELAQRLGGDPDQCAGGVYVFDGRDATPDDQDGDPTDGADPVVYDRLEVDPLVGGTVASYRIPFVDGVADDGDGVDYTVAFTCDFEVDADPDRSEYAPQSAEGEPGFGTMRWATTDVTVFRGETAVVDFPIAMR
jgi:hypothetical protein